MANACLGCIVSLIFKFALMSTLSNLVEIKLYSKATVSPNVKSPVFQRIFILEEKFEMFQDALEISYHLSYLSH